MAVETILEVASGPRAGEKIRLEEGQVMMVGRTARAQFVLPDDAAMSSAHFLVRRMDQICRIHDQRSTNGTLVNGQRVENATLEDGDQVLAGETRFVYHRTETTGPPRFGSWLLHAVPEGWESLAPQCVRRTVQGAFPSNAVFTEDKLEPDKTLAKYVEDQKVVLAHLLPDAKVVPGPPASIAGADEVQQLGVAYTREGRNIIQRQYYARHAAVAGVLTLTTTREEFSSVQAEFDAIVAKAELAPVSETQT
jgi:pSer/pThr/pTyr-binding forkhead associated (FHA) protein